MKVKLIISPKFGCFLCPKYLVSATCTRAVGGGGSTASEQQLSLQESQLCARQGACATGTAPAAGAVNILILQTDNKVSYPLAQGHANLFMPGS